MTTALVLTDFWQHGNLPAADELMNQVLAGAKTIRQHEDWHDWLCPLFGLSKKDKLADWPLAPILLEVLGIEAEAHYWLVADPIVLVPTRDDLVLADAAPHLREDESTAFIKLLNDHFRSDSLEFIAASPAQWLVRLPNNPQLQTQATEIARNQPIRAFLAKGQDASQWLRWQNEIQMLLFEHPINQAREARAETAVNSIWFWGGGRYPSDKERAAVSVSSVAAEDRTVSSLAAWREVPMHSISGSEAEKLACLAPGSLTVLPFQIDRVADADEHPAQAWLSLALRSLRKNPDEPLDLVITHRGRAVVAHCRNVSTLQKIGHYFARQAHVADELRTWLQSGDPPATPADR